MAKILLVEDDADTARLVSKWLGTEGHLIDHAADGKEALELLSIQEYDLLVLDWDVPNVTGVEICQSFRKSGGIAPILLLTGKTDIADKEHGLDCGADDYLTKPFHNRELSARLRALLRRPSQVQGTVLSAGNITLDPTKFEVKKDGHLIDLPPKEFALLEFLMRHPGVVFSADALLNRVWSTESEATALTVRVRVAKLRSRLDSPGHPSIIRNVFGRGYMLDGKGT